LIVTLWLLQVSPADGTILHFGTIKDLQVEQVKGITYSLDALLGVETPTSPPSARIPFANADHEVVLHREFADINGIEYSLSQLIGSTDSVSRNGITSEKNHGPATSFGETTDASVVNSKDFTESLLESVKVAAEMGPRGTMERRRSTCGNSVKPGHALFFSVIYLAPGDYHRFHSPTAWVVEKRRHFIGSLFRSD
jgi:phosphatidylserine decarboxylase